MDDLDFSHGDLAGLSVMGSLGVEVVGLPCIACDAVITDVHEGRGLVPVGGQSVWYPICSDECVQDYFANGGGE